MADALGPQDEPDALLARLAERVLVLAGVLLGEGVDVLVGAVVAVLGEPGDDLDVLVGVLVIGDRDRRGAGVPQQLRPLAPLGAVERHVALVVRVGPHDHRVDRAAVAGDRHVREVLPVLEELARAPFELLCRRLSHLMFLSLSARPRATRRSGRYAPAARPRTSVPTRPRLRPRGAGGPVR